MTKLEEKLIQLGYRRGLKLVTYFYKKIDCDSNSITITFIFDYKFSRIINYYVEAFIKTEQGLEYSQQAFNQLQKDLEVLKDE